MPRRLGLDGELEKKLKMENGEVDAMLMVCCIKSSAMERKYVGYVLLHARSLPCGSALRSLP